MLFLHQEIKLVQTEAPGAILFLIVTQWFQQSDENNSAFVLDLIAHNSMCGEKGGQIYGYFSNSPKPKATEPQKNHQSIFYQSFTEIKK
jgi:hypothetical protein